MKKALLDGLPKGLIENYNKDYSFTFGNSRVGCNSCASYRSSSFFVLW